MKKGKLIIISGPSGVGKGTIVKKILSMDSALALSISSTTRPKREGEVNGREYFFLTKEEFIKNIHKNNFAEYAEYAGNYYGTSYSTIDEIRNKGLHLILEIEVNGAQQIKNKYPEAKTIFIMPPNLAELKKRLIERNTNDEHDINIRLAQVDREIAKSKEFDVRVINDDLEIATLAVIEAIYSD